MFVAAHASEAPAIASNGLDSKNNAGFIKASDSLQNASNFVRKQKNCSDAEVVVWKVSGDIVSELECDIRRMKDGGYHIGVRHIPHEKLSVVMGSVSPTPGTSVAVEDAIRPSSSSESKIGYPSVVADDGPCLNVFCKINGTCLTLDPPPYLSDALKDVRRRIAALEDVGLWQVGLACGDRKLSAPTLGQGLQGWAENVTVIVESAKSVYQKSVDTARRSKGLVKIRQVEFPEPQGIDINMMPFVMGDKRTLPEAYRHYWPMIEACPYEPEAEDGKIGFLTIQEGEVAEGQSQRRPGLHLETPGIIMREGKVVDIEVQWGGGHAGETLLGGIYMASTVQDSCTAWDMRIANPADVVGPLGGAEHLRELLGPGSALDASNLYWMTDCTPHESLPLAVGQTRQYFRLVTSSVSVWYKSHSTSNPLGHAPDPCSTRILTQDKFVDVANAEVRDEDGVWRFEHLGICSEESAVTESIRRGKHVT